MTKPFNKRNWFNLTNEHMTTLEMGQLVPMPPVEVLPGDTFKLDQGFFSRLEAMLAPAFSNVDLMVYNFYVPNRILMEEKEWEDYITGGVNGDSDVVKPYMVSPTGGYSARSLADHLGLPIGVAGYKHSALPFRAYAKIYNDWFRNQNLVDELPLSTASGLDTTTNTTLQNKMWEKDYFTAALPWPQRGDSAVVPLTGDAVTTLYAQKGSVQFKRASDSSALGSLYAESQSGDDPVTLKMNTYDIGFGTTPQEVYFANNSSGNFSALRGVTDLSTASSTSINTLRLAFQVQRFLETQARGGARLVETVLSHFGVRIPDARLQRSELIGANRLRFMVSPVEQTSSTDAVSPQGNLAGRGTLNSGCRRVVKSFTEHGYMMTLISVMPRTMYAQGMPRHWSRESRYDEYWPVFAHLGEQEVKNKEIYVSGNESQDDGVFGYNDRYAELRHIPSTVSGLFRPGQSLDYWTQTRQFDTAPTLSKEFVTADPSKRIFAVTSNATDSIVLMYKQSLKACRCLPKFGNPGLIDHM